MPAYFNDAQRQATKDAGKIAGLDVLRIINEPTAAALAYGLDKKKDEKVAVFDLGGGTYDISVLELYDVEGSRQFEVKSTNGDTHLGGDDFDQRVIDWIVGEFKRDQGIDLSKDPMALQRLKEAAEKAKMELSSTMSTDINLPFITADQSGPKHLNYSLTRAKFEQLVDDLIQRTIEPMKKALKDAGLEPKDIDEVILVGGSTRIPKIQEDREGLLRQGAEPVGEPGRSRGDRRGDPGRGAHRRAEGRAAARRHAALARHRDARRRDHGAHPAQHDDPDQEVARRSPRPTTTRRRSRSTCCRASASMARDNRTIGKFQLTGIPPAPRGMPQIEVTFDIDANGILHVSAKDKATGKEQKIRIEASSGLSDSDIDKMVKDAEKNAAEDKKRREEIDTRNRLDSMTYEVEKNAKEWSDKLAADLKAKLDARGGARAQGAPRRRHERDPRGAGGAEPRLQRGWPVVLRAEPGRRPERRRAGRDRVDAGRAGATGAGGKPQDDVVEADYEIVDESKK